MIPPFESMLEAIYRAALQPGDVAIDIGAHVGRHVLPMAQMLGPTGKVFAFEPLPLAYSELKAAVASAQKAERNLADVITYQLALGEEEGEAQFVFVPDFPEYSGFKERVYHLDSLRRTTITVEVRRLDSFSADLGKVRFLKVDAEGGELTILRGAARIIAESSPIVAFEMGNAALVNYPYNAADYFDFFADRGYTLFSIFGIPLSREDFLSAADEQLFWDYIAIPRTEPWPFRHEPIRVLLQKLNEKAAPPIEQVVAGTDIARLRELSARTKIAEAQLAAMRASTSWRVTEPLRWISKLLRK